MADSLFNEIYNPDVLSCLANLSNDEVFTPPEVANAMLDMLPQELFSNPDTTFLDPACKSGVFLREIAKRLISGLEMQIPDLQKRIDHIFHKQLFGIAITELTSLLSRRSVYCSKYPNTEYSVSRFPDVEGNIRYKRTKHTWQDGKCIYCGASQKEYDRDSLLESHAYQFIHSGDKERVFDMKFDVIISNPPYQLSTGGSGRQAKPIYNLFVEKAKELKPKYITMIIPSRWFSGGFGLDKFRKEMLNDNSIREIVDFPNSSDVFSGVDIAGGVCYFLWDRDNKGNCNVTNVINNIKYSGRRELNEFPTFIRYSQAIPIIRKVLKVENPKEMLEQTVSPQRPFGLPTNYSPKEKGIPCWFIQKIGKKYADKKDIIDNNDLLYKWKLLVPKAPIAGQTDFTKPIGFYYDGNTRIASPGECCTESWIVAGAFDTKEETLNFKSYLFTKTVRFLLLQTVVSQDVLRNKFCFVPALDKYDCNFTDEYLCQRWKITENEWNYIDSRICNIGGDDNG
ncbi:MAG: Eco57I restriction-modification methylase domain-containing protein [Ruminococcus sp.]